MKSENLITEQDGLCFVRFPHFTCAGLPAHAVTTRKGGVSVGALSSLNMGRRALDTSENLTENHRRAANALGVSPDSFVFSDQVHGVRILEVNRENFRDPVTETDGLMTNVPGITLATVYADCMPVMLYDPVNRAIGMVHAGWRGTAQSIGPLLVNRMAARYGSKPQHLLAGLGPSIGPCCFQVGVEVAESFLAMAPLKTDTSWLIEQPGKPHIDLAIINRLLLIDAGVEPQSILSASLCTYCNADLFFSHRRDNGYTGRMAALMAIQE